MPGDSKKNGQGSYRGSEKSLDAVNVRLLSELQDNPRLSMSELGRRIGMSAPAVTERVQRMERAGVISGFRMDVDPAALGMPVTALVRIRPGPGQLPRIAATARETPQVVECHRITGEDCFHLKMHAPNIQRWLSRSELAPLLRPELAPTDVRGTVAAGCLCMSEAGPARVEVEGAISWGRLEPKSRGQVRTGKPQRPGVGISGVTPPTAGPPLPTPGDGILAAAFDSDGSALYVAGEHVPWQKYDLDP